MAPKVPYVIGIAGSVAVGKSTFARILQALLARWPEHPRVDLITTDGFLFPNAVLEDRGIMNRKGFPESYDTKTLLTFLRDLKSGALDVKAPVYSHVVYDIVDGETVSVQQPDILIIEGLNVLQVGSEANEFVSDYFDFSIFIDADESDVEQWYVERFHKLRETIFRDPDSFFQNFAHMSDEEADAMARSIWHEINGKNLVENIEPTKSRASLMDLGLNPPPPLLNQAPEVNDDVTRLEHAPSTLGLRTVWSSNHQHPHPNPRLCLLLRRER